MSSQIVLGSGALTIGKVEYVYILIYMISAISQVKGVQYKQHATKRLVAVLKKWCFIGCLAMVSVASRLAI